MSWERDGSGGVSIILWNFDSGFWFGWFVWESFLFFNFLNFFFWFGLVWWMILVFPFPPSSLESSVFLCHTLKHIIECTE